VTDRSAKFLNPSNSQKQGAKSLIASTVGHRLKDQLILTERILLLPLVQMHPALQQQVNLLLPLPLFQPRVR
jgi:hypothetical protein